MRVLITVDCNPCSVKRRLYNKYARRIEIVDKGHIGCMFPCEIRLKGSTLSYMESREGRSLKLCITK